MHPGMALASQSDNPPLSHLLLQAFRLTVIYTSSNYQWLGACGYDNASWTTPEELTTAILNLLSLAAVTVNGAKLVLFGSF